MNLRKMKLKKLLLFFISLIITCCFSFAQRNTTISGLANDYSGYTINIYQITDPISETKQPITSLNIGADGSFHSTFELTKTTYAEAEFDAYQATIYLQPGESYELIFPPLKKVSPAQKRNPFFQYDEIAFATKSSDPNELNRLIQQFELAYLKEETKYFNEIYHRQSEAAVDSLKHHLTIRFPETENSYFENYKFYRIAFAEFALQREHPDELIKKYFINHKPNLDLPPCVQLFTQLFSDHFTFEANQIQGTEFRRLVAQAKLPGIEDYFMTNNGWDKNLSRLVILQSIKDAYKQGQFSPRSMKHLLDKVQDSDWPTSKKEIAKRLENKISYLEPGTEAPNFSMTDFNGIKHQLKDFNDKYVYLNFTRVANPICRQHLDQLKKSSALLQQELHIVNLIMPGETNKKELIRQQEWPGDFFIIDEQTADEYQVSTFPMAYLVDKEGKFVFSPAPNPLDGFEQRFLNLLKQERIEELRRQGK